MVVAIEIDLIRAH